MTAEQMTDRITSIGQQLAGAAATLPIKRVQHILFALLGLWLIVVLVQLAMVIFSPAVEPAATNSGNSTVAVSATDAPIDIDKLKGLNLFGRAGTQAQPAVAAAPVDDVTINAEKTKLNLSLEGIVHSPEGAGSIAVIVYQGKQDQYAIGDKLPVGNQVELAKVMTDHVILSNAGNYESLWLYDDEKLARQSQSAVPQRKLNRPAVTDKRADDTATDLAKDYRNRLYKNPSSLAEVLRISPAQKNGQMVGYRVSPGRDREQFSQLGFKTNDVVTSINGIELNEPAKALEIYKLMRTAKEATFIVDRNGQPVEVLVALEE